MEEPLTWFNVNNSNFIDREDYNSKHLGVFVSYLNLVCFYIEFYVNIFIYFSQKCQ